MNTVLLCPGPSLARYQPIGTPVVTVGVNRAATLHRCDVWAATDWPLIVRTRPLGQPILFTITATRDALARKQQTWPWLVVTHDGIAGRTVCNRLHPWTRFTATAALAYLAWLGATRIDVYGADMHGTQDWDGEHAGEYRTDTRWAEERAIWDRTVADINAKVIRHA